MEDGIESSPNLREGSGDEDEKALLFLDSLDAYLTLLDSLSSNLRQGWVELASARHSMGSSRISSALFDLKVQPAPTTLQVTQSVEGSQLGLQPNFILSKWSSSREGKCSTTELEVGGLQKKSQTPQLRHRGPRHLPEVQNTNSTVNESPITADNYVQRERAKSLSVFGTLVSPKLRAAQFSFETALEYIIEIANIRSVMLSAFAHLPQDKECSEESDTYNS